MIRSRRLTIHVVVSLAVLGAVAGLAWWTVAQLRTAIHTIESAERRVQAVRFTLNLVLDYVEQKGDWPRSWEELLSLKRWTYGRDPATWTASPMLADDVEIDFAAPLDEVREESPATFRAIAPLGGPAAIPLDPDYAEFLRELRRLVPRPAP